MWKDWKVVKALSRLFLEEVEVADPRQETTVLVEATAGNDKKNSIIKKLGLVFGGSSGSRLTYETATGFDFAEIERAYLTDSYIRQAVDKYVDFMFKAGWDVVGKNPKAVEYINMRLSAMSVATDKPLGEFLNDIAEDLIKYHNCFILKARASNTYQYPPGITATPVLSSKTVAGYFILPVSTITIARDTNGTVKKYKQAVSSSGSQAKPIEIKPEDMIHITIDKPAGRAFGFPFLYQALDDVKLLRQVEELVDRLIYKNIFPLMVYKVGLDKEGLQSTDTEIEEVKAQLGELTMDGGIVIPERHNISAVGVEGKALDVEGYLKYFKQRVFTALGVSPTIMGEGDTSNRSTSDNMDQMFKDRIKAFQKIMAEYINSKMMYELLLEGGFDTLVKPEDAVEFRFREIDLQAKMAEQNHIVQLFTQNAITHEQLRTLLGYDPVTPEEEKRLYCNMITIPIAVQTAEASAAASGTTAANNAGANKNQPTNQSGKRPSAKTTKNSEAVLTRDNTAYMYGSLNTHYESLKSDVIRKVRQSVSKKPNTEFDGKEIELTLRMAADYMSSLAEKYVMPSFIEGVNDVQNQTGLVAQQLNYTYNIGLLREEFKGVTNRLMTDLQAQIEKVVRNSDKENIIPMVVGAFEALQYRLKFMSTTQLFSAYNIGFSKAARALGYKEAFIETVDMCPVCGTAGTRPINLLADKLPPFHPNCSCKLTLIKKEGGQ